MAGVDIDQHFTYDGRLASFRKTTKKRGSAASGRGSSKALNWPHKQITPASLAKAGFYFCPSPDSPDNCVCFLCEKGLDGWEAGDDPLREHLTHSSNCGWAILTAIELEIPEYALQDPTLPQLVEARKATFAGRWPHDGKKGWQCKTKQLVDAGWMYTPTAESDDMATCTYCQLALDGWEPSDKPYDEHFKRSPNCAFFTIERQSQPAPKKTGRGKASRGSKASRLSTQSVQSIATLASEASVADATAEPEDSALTTTSTMAQGKKTKGKKGTASKAAKGGRKKTKKEETAAVEETEDDIASVAEPTPAKSTRGRKRGSEAVEDSVISTTTGPARKKRATKTRGSVATESSTVSEDTAVPETANSSKSKKGRPSKTRKASAASNASVLSLQNQPEEFPDDDEIERQLEADLERQFTEDELVYDHHKLPNSSPKPQRTASKQKPAAYAMFDPTPSEAGESEIEDELKGLQNEMDVGEAEEIHIPKKGYKTGTRKASKKTKATKQKQPSPTPSPSPEPETDQDPYQTDDAATEDNRSIANDDTAVNIVESVHSSAEMRGRSRNREASVVSEDSVDVVTYVEPDDTPVKCGRRPKNARQSRESTEEADDHVEAGRGAEEDDLAASDVDGMQIAEDPVETSPVRDESHLSVAEPLSTPGHRISPAQSAKQAAISPSPSPQSSDAENQPPSSRPSATASTKRIALAPLAETPSRMSPSKRNVMAGLQSTTPWASVNLDAIFASPRGRADKENGVERLLIQGKDLTSPEKQMTVEEWIYFNAGEAEKRLKYECEKMVGIFEGEGTKAMKVLEGLSVE